MKQETTFMGLFLVVLALVGCGGAVVVGGTSGGGGGGAGGFMSDATTAIATSTATAASSSATVGGGGAGGQGGGGGGGGAPNCEPFDPPGPAPYCVEQGHPDKPYGFVNCKVPPSTVDCVMIVAAAVIWCCDTKTP